MESFDGAITARGGRHIAVIGLGYVGLPVAVAFGRSGAQTIGFDIDRHRIVELKDGFDRTNEVSSSAIRKCGVHFTADQADLSDADFFIITVPTPIDHARRPDLRALESASRMVGSHLSKGAIVVYESTVYPGATEEFCIPILEGVSGLKLGRDFSVGYSPERINPGDEDHRFETIQKVVSGSDARTADIVASVYGSVVQAGVFRASSIKVAEAAKVIENTQRDLNIALMNELSTIFHLLDIPTADVLQAAGTKWNFLPFSPGLVGGHCIGVDPYYLTHRAEIAGYHPEVILAGRRVNDGVGHRIARECVRMLLSRGDHNGHVTVLGVTFKENVPDTRNSKVIDVISDLRSYGLSVAVHDPHADKHQVQEEYGITLTAYEELEPASAVICAVPHRRFLDQGWDFIMPCLKNASGVVIDVKSKLDMSSKPDTVELWRL